MGAPKHKHNLNEKVQSAYMLGHSTETALVRIQNDLLIAIDNKQYIFLVLLDMSATVDTIDYGVLLNCLLER